MLCENRAKMEDFTKNNFMAAMYSFFAMDIRNCKKSVGRAI